MSCKLFNNYELVDENVNLYEHENLNKLAVVDGDEKLNHFCAKGIMFYILTELNYDVICDFQIPSFGFWDLGFSWDFGFGILDLTTRTIYQLESGSFLNNKQLTENIILAQNDVDVIIIFLEDLPDDIFQRYLKLKEYVFSD